MSEIEDILANEVLNDDLVANTICPGFIEDWSEAIADVAVGRIPKGAEVNPTFLSVPFIEDNTSSDSEKTDNRHLIYPEIVKRIESGISEIVVSYELYCPWCGCKLVLRQNRKTKVTFYGCSGFPQCRYSIGEKELVRHLDKVAK